LHRVLKAGGIIRLQTWDSDASIPRTVEQTLGIAWPRQVGLAASSHVDVLCTGPTDWWLFAPDADAAAALREWLVVACRGSAFRATELSHAFVRVHIEGPESRVLLAKGSMLDLHPSRFLPGSCARTRFAAMPVIMRCIQESAFDCIVALSYLDYFLSWITDAAAEFPSLLS
jgi:heterotetrameric sarcosine oxidase gamma subunit